MFCLQGFLYVALVFQAPVPGKVMTSSLTPSFPWFSYSFLAVNCLLQDLLWYAMFLHSDYMPYPLHCSELDNCYNLHIYTYIINSSIIAYPPTCIILYGAVNPSQNLPLECVQHFLCLTRHGPILTPLA